MANRPRQPNHAGRGRPESKFIVAVGDIVRYARAHEFHEGAVLIRQIADRGDLGKLITSMRHYSGGTEEAAAAMTLCLAREHCFYCAGKVRRCPFCNGTGIMQQSGTTCRACTGHGLTSCQFCADTGLANIDQVPTTFWGKVVRERALFGIRCLNEAVRHYQQTRGQNAKDPNQLRQHARLAVSFSRRAKSILLEAKRSGARPERRINKLLSRADALLDRAAGKLLAATRDRKEKKE